MKNDHHENNDTAHQLEPQKPTKWVMTIASALRYLRERLPAEHREELLYFLKVTLISLTIVSAMISLYNQIVHGHGPIPPSEILEVLKQL